MRLHQIDALRGFALFGILIVNIFIFHAPYGHYREFYGAFEGFEAGVVEHMIFFFGGKMMFIYAFLFGYSFWLQLERKESIADLRPYWNRRMWVLAGIGILHIVFLSFGDILLPYALLGLLLPFIAHWTNRQLIALFLVVYFIPVYDFLLQFFIDYPGFFMSASDPLETYIEANQSGNLVELFRLRLTDYFSFRNEKLVHYIPKEFSLFIIGILAARMELAKLTATSNALVFFIVALAYTLVMYFFSESILGLFNYEEVFFHRILVVLIIHLGEFLQGMCYIVGFFLLWKWGAFRRIATVLTYSGRLSLTNYLMQSLICVFIFSILGFYARLKPSQLIYTAVVIYLGQLIFSYFWLLKYPQGPMERIWRKLSNQLMKNES
ncbi:MAG: DUF418 domain-containing protein [Bacteroidota bacterium]